MALEILVPVAVFTSVVLVLTTLVMLTRRLLEPSGIVTLSVNGERSLEVRAGRRLLWALAEQGIFLPAACGGRGTCGQCRVTVTAGGGVPLPTEATHLSPAEAAAGTRLACMLKIREPLALTIPGEILEVRRHTAVVESNRNVSSYLKELVLRPDSPIEAFESGDYMLIEAPPHQIDFADFDIDASYRERWQENGFFDLKSKQREPLARAYSLANPPQDNNHMAFVIRIALPPPTAPGGTPPGQVSSYLFSLKPGDHLSLRGPFGDFHIKESDREMVFVGGGAGIAPLRSMILDLLARGSRRRMSFWYGARDQDELCYYEEFTEAAAKHEHFSYHVALSSQETNPDWRGFTGFVHQVLHEQYLKTHPTPGAIEYYLCGPPLMSAAVLRMLEQLGVPRENVFFDDFGA